MKLVGKYYSQTILPFLTMVRCAVNEPLGKKFASKKVLNIEASGSARQWTRFL